jgi:hypothetical protein
MFGPHVDAIPDGTGRTPEVVPHLGLRNRIFVGQNEKRDLISRALGAEIPNGGSFRSHTESVFFCNSAAWPDL